jgi:hypothetical protein
MAYFQTKDPNLGKFWKVLQLKVSIGIFVAILFILRQHWLFYGHLVHLVVIWYNFSHFGMLYREKSGNPEWVARLQCGQKIHQTVAKKSPRIESNLEQHPNNGVRVIFYWREFSRLDFNLHTYVVFIFRCYQANGIALVLTTPMPRNYLTHLKQICR